MRGTAPALLEEATHEPKIRFRRSGGPSGDGSSLFGGFHAEARKSCPREHTGLLSDRHGQLGDPSPALLDHLRQRGLEVTPIENTRFGGAYPHANKIYAIRASGPGPLVFLDTDMLFVKEPEALEACAGTDSFAALRGGSTFPRSPAAHMPSEIWRALYRLFGLDPEARPFMTDCKAPAFPYCNAGVMILPDADRFGEIYLETAIGIYDGALPEMADQPVLPFLDQIAFPIAIARMGKKLGFLNKAYNDFDPKPDTVVWHYHYAARLVLEGRVAYPHLIEDLLSRDDLRQLRPQDSPLDFWLGSVGQEIHARTLNEVGRDLSPLQLMLALERRGAPIR